MHESSWEMAVRGFNIVYVRYLILEPVYIRALLYQEKGISELKTANREFSLKDVIRLGSSGSYQTS